MTARYVVLHHTGIAQPHYDLMFDVDPGARLITWRSPIWPLDRPTSLTRLPDHRREYLTFEGEIASDRGRVDRVAEGACMLDMCEDSWQLRWESRAVIFHRIADERWQASPARDSRSQ